MEKDKKSNRKKIIKVVKWIFFILVIYFLSKYLIKNIEDIKNMDFHINWKIFAGSMLFFFIYKYTLASLWHYITKLNKASIPYFDAVTAYLYSILGKYIPGKVFMLAARIPSYERNGVKGRKVAVCFLLENVCTLLGAAFLFIISLFFFPNEILNEYKWLTLGLILLFFVCINPRIINFFLKIVERLTKKEDMVIPISYIQMIRVVILFILNWLIVGIGFYMLVCSIYPIPLTELLYVGGIYGLSAIIGILAIFAPSGIGVREGIIVMGLTLVLPSEYAIIISVISRLWTTIAELILIFIAFTITKFIGLNKNKVN